MAKLKQIQNNRIGEPDYFFDCPGCQCSHGIWIAKPEYTGASWDFNNDINKPTVSPSILVRYASEKGIDQVCHSFIRDGKIQYLSDCTHSLAGQTVELPETN